MRHQIYWILLFLTQGAFAFHTHTLPKAQDSFEYSTETVVRNKLYYKENALEVNLNAGIMPYDSIVDHFMVGGRLSWHLADHYGWEIVDAQLMFPAVTSYTTSLVSANGLSNLQAEKVRMTVSTNFLFSPLYSKVRLLGSSVIRFDAYLVGGLGMGQVELIRASAPSVGAATTIASLSTNWHPMVNFGIGLKVFLGRSMAITVDLRDYILISPLHSTTRLNSHYSVFAGLSFFIPALG